MSASSQNINYAELAGIHSLAAAIIFIVLYAPFLVFYLWGSIRKPAVVPIILAIFCQIRMTAFGMRAISASSASLGHTKNFVLAEQITYSVGFFAVVYSVYALVLDRGLAKGYQMRNVLTKITANRFLFHMNLTAAVVIGIIGAVDQSSGSTQAKVNLGKTLRTVSVIIFLASIAVVAFHTALLIKDEKNDVAEKYRDSRSFGESKGTLVLCVVTLLLFVREAFYVGTIGNLSKQQQENLFYPFSAVPEFAVVVLLAIPDIVPKKVDLPTRDGNGVLLARMSSRSGRS